MLRTILVPFGGNLVNEPALDGAYSVASQMNSHIRALLLRPDVLAVTRELPEVVADQLEWQNQQEAETAKNCFDAWRKSHRIPVEPVGARLDSCFASWTEQFGEIEEIVTRFGRVSDLIVMSRFTAGNITAERCFDAAVFGSGRPTLLVPEGRPSVFLEHVMIAWDGSIEASHAVFAAMPLLRAAPQVSIFNAPEAEGTKPYGPELAEALSWYGIAARRIVQPRASSPPGAALLEAASRGGATLIVMGAYTHSRLRRGFLGGVTARVMAAAAIPVLMCH
jgi:nucleotide-binding universal stress UspA family protein